MQVKYLQTDVTEHYNVDIYPRGQRLIGADSLEKFPAIVIAAGGGGKDLVTGDARRGKHAAGYHDLAEYLAMQGFWVLIPSRRGDPQRTPELQSGLCPLFRERLPGELFADPGPNEGIYSHERQRHELKTVIECLPELCDHSVDMQRVGLLGKSAGCGVSLRLTSENADKISSLALWGGSLNVSQWFAGPRSDHFFKRVLEDRNIRYDRQAFMDDLCNATDFVGYPSCPILFACAALDPFAPEPTEADPWATPEEQMQLMHYAVRSRYSKVTILKGAEHTMYKELQAWRSYALTISNWFQETLV
jgi:dienelactone hydrolase